MGATPQAIQVALRYDGKVFVPDQPFLNLPAGTVIHVWTSTDPTDWPPGYIESTMDAWGDDDFVEPDELPMGSVEPID